MFGVTSLPASPRSILCTENFLRRGDDQIRLQADALAGNRATLDLSEKFRSASADELAAANVTR